MSDERRPALFGKLPSRADFVRVGRADDALRFVESWLTAAVEHSRGELAPEPARFLLSHAGEVLLGCWVPSRDAIGRQFPFACFERVPRDLAELGWSLLLGLHESFLGAAEALLRSACTATGVPALDALQAELGALVRPHASELVRARYDAQARLTAESAASFERRAFGALERLPYALWTLREAARRGAADLTLDVPATCAFDLFVWLALAGCFEEDRRRFPALIWCPQQARALIAGGPSPSALAFLVDRRHASSSRWPVWTERPAAPQALQELAPAAREALAARGSLANLVAALRGPGG